LNILVV
jgi:hypothetical protein